MNIINRAKRSLSYRLKRAAFLFRHIFRIVPAGGAVRFEKKYFTKRCYSGQNCKKMEARKHQELAGQAKLGIVEIGILRGETSRILSQANPNVPVYGIDPLIIDSMSDTMIGSEEEIRKNTGDLKNFHFIKGYSYDVVGDWNEPFDYLFIDGSHFYDDVKKDFEDWYPKLAPGGIVSFHDSTMYRGGMEYWPGPSKLADELIFDPRLQFVCSEARLTVFRKKD